MNDFNPLSFSAGDKIGVRHSGGHYGPRYSVRKITSVSKTGQITLETTGPSPDRFTKEGKMMGSSSWNSTYLCPLHVAEAAISSKTEENKRANRIKTLSDAVGSISDKAPISEEKKAELIALVAAL